MPLVTDNLPNLVNGVSEQPALLRRKSQGELQENAYSDPVTGLTKRPNTNHLAKVSDTSLSDAFIHSVKRDPTEKYLLFVPPTGGTMQIRNAIDGTSVALNVSEPTDYTIDSITFSTDTATATTAEAHELGVGVKVQIQGATVTSGTNYYVGEFTTIAGTTGSTIKYTMAGTPLVTPSGTMYYNKVQTTGTYYDNVISYFSSTTPSKHFAATSVADYTYFVNKSKTITKSGTTTTSRNYYEGLIYVKVGDYKTKYTVHLKTGTDYATVKTIDHTTEHSQDTNYEENTRTDKIAEELYEKLTDQTTDAYGTHHKQWDSVDYVFSKEDGGSIIHVRTGTYPTSTFTPSTADNFRLEVEDSRGGVYMFAFKDTYPSFGALPPKGPDSAENWTVKIVGNNQKNQDDYFVQLQKDANASTWIYKEVTGDGQDNGFDAATMPHRIVKNSDGSFSLQQNPWVERKAGNDDSNPSPSFVGKTINDIFFHQNRLGFLSDENVIFSEAGTYYNFWLPTVLISLDTNPIDVAVSTNQVSILKHAVPFAESLLIFSDLSQFVLKSSDFLSPNTVRIDVTTNFEASLTAKPVAAGKYVFFGVNKGLSAGVREFYVEVQAETNDATDITAHIPEYMTGEVKQMAASSNSDMILLRTNSTEEEDNIFVYAYHWQGTEKVQSAWSKWKFDDKIINFSFLEDEIYLVIERPANGVGTVDTITQSVTDHTEGNHAGISLSGGTGSGAIGTVTVNSGGSVTTVAITTPGNGYAVDDTLTVPVGGAVGGSGTVTVDVATIVPKCYLEKLTLGEDEAISTTTESHPIHLDRRVKLTSAYTSSGFQSTYYADAGASNINLKFADKEGDEKTEAEVIATAPTTTTPIYVGIEYTFKYHFSEQVMRDPQKESAYTSGRLQLRNMTLNFAKSGYFKVNIKPVGHDLVTKADDTSVGTDDDGNRKTYQRDGRSHTFNGRVVGKATTVLNATPIVTSNFRFPVLAKSDLVLIEIVNDTFLPCTFQSAEWEGLYHTRSRRA